MDDEEYIEGVLCELCDGTGLDPVSEEGDDCPECGGSGFYWGAY